MAFESQQQKKHSHSERGQSSPACVDNPIAWNRVEGEVRVQTYLPCTPLSRRRNKTSTLCFSLFLRAHVVQGAPFAAPYDLS